MAALSANYEFAHQLISRLQRTAGLTGRTAAWRRVSQWPVWAGSEGFSLDKDSDEAFPCRFHRSGRQRQAEPPVPISHIHKLSCVTPSSDKATLSRLLT